MNPQSYIDNFEKNIQTFTEFYPLAGTQISLILRNSDRLKFCLTEKGEENLISTRFGLSHYYHAQSGAQEEAVEMIKGENLESIDILYVYGLGLGYVYEELTEWLKKSPHHHLVFLEDDLEVVFYFLHTERASRMLKDQQVTIFCFQDYSANFLEFITLQAAFLNLPRRFLVLPYYARFRETPATILCYLYLNESDTISKLILEFLGKQKGLLSNYYNNLMYLPQSKIGNELFDKFKGVPAIICGAGPSFGKNIHLLKTLQDRALIFGGGSSLNVLSYYGIIPHFGMGLDPNIEQYSRLLTNHAFFLPFFYRNRLAHDAFQSVEGPKLFVTGAPNIIANWFEKELGLPHKLIEEGHNVIHLETQVAIRMGCNPIIFVGLDLAYTNVEPYAKGIGTHPLYLDCNPPYLINNTEVVKKIDIYGKPIITQWAWVAESNWMNNYIEQHPNTTFINATEGGLGFSRGVNMTLAQAASKYLGKPYNLLDWVHTEIQDCQIQVKQIDLTRKITEFKSSLNRCLESCKKIIKSHTPEQYQKEFYDTETIIEEANIYLEIVYQNLLREIDSAFIFKIYCDFIGERQKYQSEKELENKHYQEQLYRYQFLNDAITESCHYINQAVLKFLIKPRNEFKSKVLKQDCSIERKEYQFTHHLIRIQDPELDLDLNVTIDVDLEKDKVSTFYPEGAIKSESWIKNDEFFGPSRFFSKTGQLLSETWYIQGKKVGKSWQYSLEGALIALRRYKEGELHGKQQFFYPDGSLNAQLEFVNGRLDGTVSTYDSFGRLKRELHYKKGERDGKERMWQEGNLIFECTYSEGIPIDEGFMWDIKGRVIKKSRIYNFPRDFDLTSWDPNGRVIASFKHGLDDSTIRYDETENLIQDFDKKIQKMLKDLELFSQPENMNSANQTNIELLKKTIEEMENYKCALIEVMHTNRRNFAARVNEHVWTVKNYK